jgi:hypothetical protein
VVGRLQKVAHRRRCAMPQAEVRHHRFLDLRRPGGRSFRLRSQALPSRPASGVLDYPLGEQGCARCGLCGADEGRGMAGGMGKAPEPQCLPADERPIHGVRLAGRELFEGREVLAQAFKAGAQHRLSVQQGLVVNRWAQVL